MAKEREITSELPQILNLYQRWNAVLNEVESVEKGGENKDQKYRYMEAADVLKMLRPLFARHGLILKCNPQVIEMAQDGTGAIKLAIEDSEYVSKSGTTMHVARLTMRYTLINIDKPDEVEVLFGVSDASDSSDKALHKARTSALKYALRDNFMIDSQDELEADQQTHDRAEPTRQGRAEAGQWSLTEQSFNVFLSLQKVLDQHDKTIYAAILQQFGVKDPREFTSYDRAKECSDRLKENAKRFAEEDAKKQKGAETKQQPPAAQAAPSQPGPTLVQPAPAATEATVQEAQPVAAPIIDEEEDDAPSAGPLPAGWTEQEPPPPPPVAKPPEKPVLERIQALVTACHLPLDNAVAFLKKALGVDSVQKAERKRIELAVKGLEEVLSGHGPDVLKAGLLNDGGDALKAFNLLWGSFSKSYSLGNPNGPAPDPLLGKHVVQVKIEDFKQDRSGDGAAIMVIRNKVIGPDEIKDKIPTFVTPVSTAADKWNWAKYFLKKAGYDPALVDANPPQIKKKLIIGLEYKLLAEITVGEDGIYHVFPAGFERLNETELEEKLAKGSK